MDAFLRHSVLKDDRFLSGKWVVYVHQMAYLRDKAHFACKYGACCVGK